jgi:hypothetical protein
MDNVDDSDWSPRRETSQLDSLSWLAQGKENQCQNSTNGCSLLCRLRIIPSEYSKLNFGIDKRDGDDNGR